MIRSCPRFERLGKPEIQHLDLAFRGDLDVGWFQVAVDNAAAVCLVERLGHLAGHLDRLLRWYTLLDELLERGSVDHLHDEEVEGRA